MCIHLNGMPWNGATALSGVMGGLTVGQISEQGMIANIIRTEGQCDFREIELLSHDEKYSLVVALLKHSVQEPKIAAILVRFVGNMIPYIHSSKKYTCLMNLIDTVQNSNELYGKDIYDVLDFSVVESLQPLEILSLANQLSDYLHKGSKISMEVAMWGLIRIIPCMHGINQKEYAQEIFFLSTDADMQKHAMETLVCMMFNLDLKARLSLTHFFADILKGQHENAEKIFVLKLFKHVTPTLPAKDRVVVADCVAPLLYYADGELVKVALDYFSVVIGLMPENQRYHYTQLVVGMINDLSVRADALATIEKVLAFLPTESERSEFRDVLKDFDQLHHDHDEDFDVARVAVVIDED